LSNWAEAGGGENSNNKVAIQNKINTSPPDLRDGFALPGAVDLAAPSWRSFTADA
jgi:hypothetical protein